MKQPNQQQRQEMAEAIKLLKDQNKLAELRAQLAKNIYEEALYVIEYTKLRRDYPEIFKDEKTINELVNAKNEPVNINSDTGPKEVTTNEDITTVRMDKDVFQYHNADTGFENTSGHDVDQH